MGMTGFDKVQWSHLHAEEDANLVIMYQTISGNTVNFWSLVNEGVSTPVAEELLAA